MKRLLALLLLSACSGCVLVRPNPVRLWPRHNVRVVWVMDSVIQQMQAAANDTIESIFQVTAVGVGQLCPDAVYGRTDPCAIATPADSGYLILGVVRCPPVVATAFLIRADCPNPLAPTIHIHTRGAGYRPTGNTCSPSQPDYAFQLNWRHLFDGILCGAYTRPSIYWWWANPLLWTHAYPDTLTPFGGMTKPLR